MHISQTHQMDFKPKGDTVTTTLKFNDNIIDGNVTIYLVGDFSDNSETIQLNLNGKPILTNYYAGHEINPNGLNKTSDNVKNCGVFKLPTSVIGQDFITILATTSSGVDFFSPYSAKCWIDFELDLQPKIKAGKIQLPKESRVGGRVNFSYEKSELPSGVSSSDGKVYYQSTLYKELENS